jgi:hypothetical protein
LAKAADFDQQYLKMPNRAGANVAGGEQGGVSGLLDDHKPNKLAVAILTPATLANWATFFLAGVSVPGDVLLPDSD